MNQVADLEVYDEEQVSQMAHEVMEQSIDLATLGEGERQARIELAACYRLAAHYRMTDIIYTHITVRVPDEPGHFLINPYGLMWEEITASSLVKIDVDGNKVSDSPYRVNPAGFTIHSAVHRGCHDAAWVMHTHTRAGIAVSCLADGLLPINQIALQFYGRVGYHNFEGIALDLDERERIVESLGGNIALILRNHGLLTAGPSAAQMFSKMFYLNMACEIQQSALAMGQPLQPVGDDIAQRVVEQYDALDEVDSEVGLEWQAHLRMLDRLCPDYKV